MNIYKKIIIGWMMGSIGLVMMAGLASAATSNVVFDPAGGTLSVSGACSARYVMVIIRRTSDNSVWGSSNPDCTNNAYTYEVDVPDADRTGAMFAVQVFDEATAGGGIPNTSGTVKINAPAQSIIFSQELPPTTAITMDTSSLVTTPNDQTFLDSALSQFFGIIADVNDAVQNFGTIIANTVKASLIATVNLFAKNIAVLPGGSVAVPRGANQLAGSDWLSAGMSDVFVPNTSVTSSSQIIITPTSRTDIPLAVTQKNDGSGFYVGALHPPSAAISFDWMIIQTYNATSAAQTRQSGGGGGGSPVAPTSAQAPAPAPAPDPTPTPDLAPAPDSTTTTDVTSSDAFSTPPDVIIAPITTTTDPVATTTDAITPTTTVITTPDGGSSTATSSQN